MEFVSSGAKSYSFLQSRKKCNLEVNGITLNATNRGKINFEALRDLVLDYSVNLGSDKPKEIVIEQCCITRNK